MKNVGLISTSSKSLNLQKNLDLIHLWLTLMYIQVKSPTVARGSTVAHYSNTQFPTWLGSILSDFGLTSHVRGDKKFNQLLTTSF